MRIDVDTGAYASAMDLLYDANHGVVDGMTRLANALDGCAGMSGTDSGGREWAAATTGWPVVWCGPVPTSAAPWVRRATC